MFSLHWHYSEPESWDSGDMYLKATTLEEAEREALALAKPWGAFRQRKLGIFGLTILEGDKWLSNWSSLTHTWERCA